MRIVMNGLVVTLLACFAAQPLRAEAPQGSDYQQRMTSALGAARKSADELNAQSKVLQETIDRAADPEQARKFLDDLLASSGTALETFGENSNMMTAVNAMLAYIDDRRRNAEAEAAGDPRWIERIDVWKAHAEIVRQLRQDILKEADRAKGLLGQLRKDRKYIEDVIASENVERAKVEMETALRNLRNLGNSLSEAVKVAEDRNNKMKAPAF